MNKNRKTSHILNIFQYDETTGAVTLPSTLVLTAPASNDNSTKVGTTAWVRTYVTGLSYLTGNQSITISGDATGSGTTAITLTLANTAVTPGSYGSTTLVPVVTVDSKGRITSVTTAAISGSLTFTGDVTGSGTTGTSTGLTLAASGVTAGTYTKVTVDTKGRVTVGASATTSDISEGTNLYYTDARVLSYLTANTYATQSYVGTQISNLVAAAPATLDTLNELAAALGNDPSFATTVSTSIGTKVPQARTLTINGTTYDLTANRSWTINSMVYPSAGIALSTGSAWGTSITDNSANWNTAFGWGNHASGGYLTSALAATTYASLTGAYANPAFVASLAYSKITGVPAFLTSYTETDPYRVTTVAVSGTSTKTITLTRADASTVTTTWTDIDTDTNTYVTSAGFSGGTLTLTRNDAGTVTVSLDGRYYLASNPSGYITSSSLTSYVPYTGATANIDTGGYSITAGAVTLTSNLWLKNIGTYDFIMSNATSVTTNTIRAYYNTSDELRFYAKNTAGSAVVPKIMVGDGTTFYTLYHSANIPTWNQNTTGTASNITAHTINQSVGTGNSPSFAGLTVNTGGASTWGPFVVNSTSLWGDGATLYATIGAGGAAGIMIYNPHVVWNSGNTAAAIRMGRSGGVSTGAYYEIGTGASDNFFIAKNSLSGGTQFNINSSGNATFSGTITASNFSGTHSGSSSGTNTGDQTNISGNAATATTASNATTLAGYGWASSGKDIRGADIYADSWLRNYNVNTGLYNQSSGNHFYSGAASIWNITAASNSSVRLQFRTTHESTIFGSVYGEAGNIGFLANDGNWGLRVDASKNIFTYGTDLTVGTTTSSNIYMTDTDESTRRIHCNSGRIGFLTTANGWGAYCDNSGNWFANNLSGTNTGDQTNISGKADGALKLWAASHPNDYYIVNNWTGTHWQLTSNHGAGVRVAYADSAGSAPASGGNSSTVGGYSVSTGGDANTIPTRNASGYLSPQNWIQFNGNYGLYFPNNYGLHFYPNNDGSYGPAQIIGEKNGWRGLHFGGGTGITLMMNEGEFGFHRQAVGWVARFTSGRFYGASDNVYNLDYALGNTHYWTGAQNNFTGNGNTGGTNNVGMVVYSTGGNGAQFSFHRSGAYAINMGLDSDNVIRIGGWSASPNRFQMDMSGNLTMSGDVTAYSDSRVKENIATIENALSKVLALRGVSYNRIDSDDKKTKIGVIAQETLPIVPEVVNQDNDGMYNVSYGNLAGLFIEAIKEQQKEIEELKTLIYGITR